jgi:hypothetical protein
MCWLAWAWLRREPEFHGAVHRLPPVGLLATMGALAVVELAIGEHQTKLSAMVMGGILAAVVWVAFAVVFSGSAVDGGPVDAVGHLGGLSAPRSGPGADERSRVEAVPRSRPWHGLGTDPGTGRPPTPRAARRA